MTTAAGLTAEIIDSIRAHYATGHFDRETALVRIQHAGFRDRNVEEAAEMLNAPIDAALVKLYTGKTATR